jgi:hypothetical protein
MFTNYKIKFFKVFFKQFIFVRLINTVNVIIDTDVSTLWPQKYVACLDCIIYWASKC